MTRQTYKVPSFINFEFVKAVLEDEYCDITGCGIGCSECILQGTAEGTTNNGRANIVIDVFVQRLIDHGVITKAQGLELVLSG